ncbi:MAG: glycosyl transferase [Actinomycetia bacterium]|nr:glycosyl transferase [Actinomycetes bacterium]
MSSTIVVAHEQPAVELDDWREPPPAASRWRAVWRGPEDDPAWARPALFALLGMAAILYLWSLGESGWANSYYSAAVQAGTKSWKAMFFGSTDASNFITVDKTPMSLWPMEISARIFGVNSWSILVPQALEGVATVGLLYAAVKRWFTPAAGLIAGAVLALTPIAALMFRFNNPDALLVLLLTAGAYAMTRALESGRTRWLVAAGACVGFGFLTKELQAFLVLPAFGVAYLLAGPPRLGRRVAQCFALGGAMLLSAGWWVAAVMLTPASSRPYIGGSQNNSFWNVLFGYNGFGRLTGNESGSVGGGGAGGPGGAAGTGRWGPTGITRMFNSAMGGQISWLLPAALMLLVVGLVLTARRARTDRTRAAYILWGGWLLVTGIVFSLSKGIIHEYYTVALAPAIGAIVGIGAVAMWRRRDLLGRAVLAVTLATTAAWAYTLLDRTPTWHPVLRSLVVVGGVAGALLLLAWPYLHAKASIAAAVVALGVGLAAPTAYSLSTAATAHQGAIPTAGVTVAGGRGGFGRFGGRGGPPPGGVPNFRGGGAPNFAPPNGFTPPNGGNTPNGGNAGRGGLGGLLNGPSVGSALSTLLQQQHSGYRWVAATVGANNAAGYQLASGEAIMAIGGFNGTDPTPTLAAFQGMVSQGEIHYFIGGGGFGGGGGSGTSAQIAAWVANNFKAQTVSGVTIYDLTSSSSSTST